MNKTIAMITLVFALLMNLAGCSKVQSEEPVNMALVAAIADGETVLNDNIEELSSLPSRPGSTYTFISAEGSTARIGDPATVKDLSDRGYNATMMERVRSSIQADIASRLDNYHPVSGEIDLAAATAAAVRTLNANAVEGRQNILVYYASGRSTTGLINMIQTPVYQLDVEGSAAAVAEEMHLDMSSVDEVIWYSCGDLGDDQPALNAEEKDKLKSFYRQLFTALGAKKVTFKDDLPLTESYDFDDAPVSTMPVAGTGSGLQPLSAELLNNDKAFESPLAITEEQVRFQPDSAEFLDEQAARAAIQPIADYMLNHPDLSIVLYGTCAGDMPSELGRTRAETVKASLVSFGVDANRITAITISPADDPYYQFGLGTGSEGSVNRKVVLVDANSALAQQIVSNAL